jgi:hypothetical protein
MTDELNPTDADRLELLDRIEKRLPELKLSEHSIEWTTLPADAGGNEALVVDGGGFDGENGMYLSNCGADVHIVGPIAGTGLIGCLALKAGWQPCCRACGAGPAGGAEAGLAGRNGLRRAGRAVCPRRRRGRRGELPFARCSSAVT